MIDPADVEAVARVVAPYVGPRYDDLYENKRAMINDSGRRCHDVNTPYKSDIRDAAEAAIAALVERGWTPPSSPSSAAGSPAGKADE